MTASAKQSFKREKNETEPIKRSSDSNDTSKPDASHPTKMTAPPPKDKVGRNSKQARVIAMLGSSTGTTITAMTKATGWQHSVRGFLAGVVRKKLKLKLSSKKVDGNRVYQIASGQKGSSSRRKPRRRSA